MAALMLAVFTVSAGFGVLLPLMPELIEQRLGAQAAASQVSRHTGLLTAVYTLALFLFAPAWGRVSDRLGRRAVILTALVGFGATALLSSLTQSLAAIYAERFLSGIFAAGVTPIGPAAVADFAGSEQGRARGLAFLSMAGIAGFLLGPMLGPAVAGLASEVSSLPERAGPLAAPLMATALLAFLAGLTVALALAGGAAGAGAGGKKAALTGPAGNRAIVPRLLVLTFIVSAGVGVFEVGLVLRGKQELGLSASQVALMFAECSLVMFAIQTVVFSPWFKPAGTRRLIAPALAVLAAGLFLVPRAPDFTLLLPVIAAVAASAGLLSPVITYWISISAGRAQGWELGKQTAAASLGMTAGSAAGGLLFNVTVLPNAAFVLTAGLVLLGFLLSVRLPRLLEGENRV